jgi:hypothetical protein
MVAKARPKTCGRQQRIEDLTGRSPRLSHAPWRHALVLCLQRHLGGPWPLGWGRRTRRGGSPCGEVRMALPGIVTTRIQQHHDDGIKDKKSGNGPSWHPGLDSTY